MRYFKTTAPSSPVYAAGGLVRWASEDGDVGYYATDSAATLKTLDVFLESRKPGGTPVGPPVEEITKAEYEDFLGKSKGRRFTPEREHIRGVGVIPAVVPRSQQIDDARALAVEGSPAEPTPLPPSPPSPEPPAPNLRKRGK